MLYVPERFTLWLAWIAVASLFFTVVPTGPFGLSGWIAAAGPLLHRIVPGIGIRRMAVLGLVAFATIAFIAGFDGWLETALPPAAYLFSLLLAPVPITGAQQPQTNDGAAAEEAFQLAMAREVGRARRYERPLTLVSATCSPETDLERLREAIASQVHVYAQIFHVGDRLLVIVPELDAAAYPALQQRLLTSAKAQHLTAIELGAASFPREECTASGMIETADTRRFYDLTRDTPIAAGNETPAGNLELRQS